MSETSVSCSHDTKRWLLQYGLENNIKGYDAVLRDVRHRLKGAGRQVAAPPAQVAAPAAPKKKEAKKKKKQLISWKDVEDEDEILSYMTGLKPKAGKWLYDRLENEVRSQREKARCTRAALSGVS